MTLSLRKRLEFGWQGIRFLSYVRKSLRLQKGRSIKQEDYPWMLYFQTQNKCNGRCIICPYFDISDKSPSRLMKWGLFEKIILETRGRKRPGAIAFGLHSEPLLDERIPDFIKYSKGNNKDATIMLFTNAQLLDAKLTKKLIQAGLDYVKINLPSLDKEIYASINAGLDYEMVMDNIKRFIKEAGSKVRIKIGLTATSWNEKVFLDSRIIKSWGVEPELVGLSNRCGELKAPGRVLKGQRPVGGKRSLFRDFIFNGCWFPFYIANVTCEGKVLACCNDWAQRSVLGDLNNQDMCEIWRGEKIAVLRQGILQNSPEEGSLCGGCYLYNKENAGARSNVIAG